MASPMRRPSQSGPQAKTTPEADQDESLAMPAWTAPVDLTASAKGKASGDKWKRNPAREGDSTSMMRSGISNAKIVTNSYVDMTDESRAEELMGSGLVAEFLVREFARKANRKNPSWTRADLYEWYRKTYGRPEVVDKDDRAARREETMMTEEEEEQIFKDTSHTFYMAAFARLKQQLEETICQSWMSCEDENVRKQWATANKVAIHEGPQIERFRQKVNELISEGISRHALRKDIEAFMHEWKFREVVPQFMMLECPDTDSKENLVFWEYYHRDDRKIDTVGAMPGREGAVQKLRGATKIKLGGDGFGPDSGMGAAFNAKRLPPLGGDGLGAHGSGHGLGSEWLLDRHSKTARAAFAHKFTKDKMEKKAILPSIATRMQTAASTADKRDALAEMRRCASDPGVKPLPGVQADSDLLPPVVGLAAAMKNSRLGEPLKLDASSHHAAATYIRATRETQVIPHRALLTMAKTRSIVARNGEMLTDDDIAAMTRIIKKLDRLEKVDLTDSTLLSDASMVGFLKQLFGSPACVSLTRLSFRGCMRVSRKSVDVMVSLLTESDGLVALQHLDLSGIEINCIAVEGFCEAIKNHPSLRSLHLAKCGLGTHSSAAVYVPALVSAARMECIDLSWNRFTAEIYRMMGDCVAEHKFLKEIYLVNSSSSRGPSGEAPITAFLEQLSRDKTLQLLDVSSTMLDYDASMVLEDALQLHNVMREVRVNNNPLGSVGLRSFLRLLLRSSTSALVNFECHNCHSSQVDSNPGFSLTNPCARYELDLNYPSGRALLRMLYKACENFGLSPEHAFTNLNYREGPFSHPSGKNEFGVWPVPEHGKLAATYCIDSLFGKAEFLEKPPPQVTSSGASSIMGKLFERCRISPAHAKLVPLLSHWHLSSGTHQEQQLLLQALAHDINISFSVLHSLCSRLGAHSGLSKVDVISNLIQSVVGSTSSRNRSLMLLPRLDDYNLAYKQIDRMLNLNIDHATGGYELNLGCPADYAVAQAIMVLDRWEASQAQRDGRADTSMYGNWSNVRNCVFSQSVQMKAVHEWRLPCGNSLKFDYTSWRRPPSKAVPIKDQTWALLVEQVFTSPCPAEHRLDALRSVANQVFLRAVHVRELLGMFMSIKHRVEVIVIFFHRIADPQNLKILRGRMSMASDGEDEWGVVAARLGVLNCFPFWQPEGHTFRFNLSTYEGRVGTNLVVQMGFKERIENIRNPSLQQADGTSFSFQYGIPKPWDTFATTPQEGSISLTYSCAPEYRLMDLRSEFAKVYGGWKAVAKTDETVVWWTTINECPDSLLQLMYYCMHNLPDPSALVRKIVGNTTKASISRSDFQSAVQTEGWPKLQDPEEIRLVFRALDVDNNGEITMKEWQVVIQLWKELQLSVLEFVRQLQRTFGGDLDRAWQELDLDTSDSIDLKEWLEAAKLMSYFGPTESVFHLLANDKGVIDNSSWTRLKFFWEGRQALYDSIRGSMKD